MGVIEIPRSPKGAPFEVFHSYDVDGIIHVEVKDGTAGGPARGCTASGLSPMGRVR
ncbi:hypothetical protein [Streptomyces sp. NPDC088254]|uniref:hypothetical protein n=1 Tax=Streptomyces sp. NPDC088254 TaxID=3365847 RepID=UPI00382FE631